MEALPPLAEILRAEIASRGPLSFRDFMARALYDPEHGFYGSGKARVGRAGDFFTNVSVGPLFGRLLARQFSEMWHRLGEPAEFVLVEQGAHEGHCAADVLGGLRDFDPACFAATTVWLVEPIAALQAAQKKTLHEFLPSKIRWFHTLEELPEFCGVHYSNELVDAFPVHRVVWRGGRWQERLVDFQDGRFVFVDAEISDKPLREQLTRLPAVPPDYETEINLHASSWLEQVAARLRAGFVLVVDYGFPRAEYYRPDRTDGTLSAYAAHQRVPDPLHRPGDIDLTAHVDFTTLAETAAQTGLALAGFADQHHFMVGLGRLHFQENAPLTPAAQKELRAFQTLMHPGLMGRSFHALCLAKAVGATNPPLAGFQFSRDARHTLFAT